MERKRACHTALLSRSERALSISCALLVLEEGRAWCIWCGGQVRNLKKNESQKRMAHAPLQLHISSHDVTYPPGRAATTAA